MKFLKNLLDFYINSSIHVSLAVVALTLVTAAEFNFSISRNLLIFIFFGSITGYNFVKYASVAKLHHRSLANSLKLIQIFSFLCFGILLYAAFLLPLKVLAVAIAFGLLTLFYALPIFPKQKNLRSLAGIKIFIIALVWAGVTVILPVFAAEMPINASVLIEFVQRLLFVVVLMFPFEIRDLKYDDLQLQTVPQELGISKTKKLGILLLLCWFAAQFFQQWDLRNLSVYIIVFLITVFLLLKSSVNQSKYYAAFWVEALPILWGFLIILSGMEG